jgi:hypothetical protein
MVCPAVRCNIVFTAQCPPPQRPVYDPRDRLYVVSKRSQACSVSPQAGRAPAELVVDQAAVRQDHYLRVTLRSTRTFRGFLLRAEDTQAGPNGGSTIWNDTP